MYTMTIQNNPKRRRTYRLKARADQQAQTRLKITEAVVALHEELGPARTTISDVAERAGVGRMTVYKHFPTEAELFRACGAHWAAQHPPPDFTDCLKTDADARLHCVLARLYAYYRRAHPMMGKILRDAPLFPALQEVLESGWAPLIDGLVDALLPPALAAPQRRRVRAALRVAETLTQSGLGDAAAAELAAEMLDGIVHPGGLRALRR
jgi:AcrR family transcriptional regulator